MQLPLLLVFLLVAIQGTNGFAKPWQQVSTSNANPVQDYGGHATVVVGNLIYEFGGLKENRTLPVPQSIITLYAHLRTYNIATSTWSTVALANSVEPPPRAWTSMAHANGKIYLFGGTYYDFAPLGDFWVFDISQSKWTDLSSLSPKPSPRTGPAMVTYGSNVLLYGGLNTYTLEGYSDVWVFNTNSQTWTLRSTSGDAPDGTALSRITFRQPLTRYLYVYGGEGFDPDIGYFAYHDKMHVLDMNTNTWSLLTPNLALPRRRLHYSAAATLLHWHFPHGDYGNCTHLDLLVPGSAVYDFNSNKWYDSYIPGYAEGPITKRSELSCVGSTCYLTGGYGGIQCNNDQLTYMNDVWRFDANNMYAFLAN